MSTINCRQLPRENYNSDFVSLADMYNYDVIGKQIVSSLDELSPIGIEIVPLSTSAIRISKYTELRVTIQRLGNYSAIAHVRSIRA